MKICIDPGHGGQDRGCAINRNYDEADYVLGVGLRLRQALQDRGHTVSMTREFDDSDPPFAARGRKSKGSDLVLSLHVNADPDPRCRGGLMCHWPGNAQGRRIAQLLTQCWPLPAKVIEAHEPTNAGNAYLSRVRAVLQPHAATCVLIEMFDSNDNIDVSRMCNLTGQLDAVRVISHCIGV